MDADADHGAEDDGPRYQPHTKITANEMIAALSDLRLLGDDLNLRNQVYNLAIVDQYVMGLEWGLQKSLFAEERTPLTEAAFVNALSQMWIFAAYELLRTWRQRAKEIVKWFDNGGLEKKLANLDSDQGYEHVGRKLRAAQIRRVLADNSIVETVREQLRLTHIPFVRLEVLRVSIAKHEVRGLKNSVALMPTHGRINSWCGALDYELESGRYSMGTISRRDIADEIRSFSRPGKPPSDSELKEFEMYMRGDLPEPFPTPEENEFDP
ncbi:MAG: hypothetical protein ABL964_01185 [Steroidobacteraceae bacterium]